MPFELESFLSVARDVARNAQKLVVPLQERPSDVVVPVHGYAWNAYEAFLHRYVGDGNERVVALSMNPGRNGAVQTGIPFTDAPTARELLDDFDRLVPRRPVRIRTEKVEMSGQKLKDWARLEFGGLPDMYRKILFPLVFPLAVLRGPHLLNVPLPNLKVQARDAANAFYETHAPRLVRAAQPAGLILLGDYAAARWRNVERLHPDLAGIPRIVAPHPAARITNRKKFNDWTRAWATLSERPDIPTFAKVARR